MLSRGKAYLFTFLSACSALQKSVCFKEIFSRELPYSVKSGKGVEGKWSKIKALPHMNNLPSVRWNCANPVSFKSLYIFHLLLGGSEV